jgi:hypothetical protein
VSFFKTDDGTAAGSTVRRLFALDHNFPGPIVAVLADFQSSDPHRPPHRAIDELVRLR